MKKPTIICTAPEGKGLIFYLDVDGERYFLFNQRYRSSVEEFFKKGVNLNTAVTCKTAGDDCVKKVISKLPLYLKYIEKEYNIAVLNQTIKKRRNLNDRISGRFCSGKGCSKDIWERPLLG